VAPQTTVDGLTPSHNTAPPGFSPSTPITRQSRAGFPVRTGDPFIRNDQTTSRGSVGDLVVVRS